MTLASSPTPAAAPVCAAAPAVASASASISTLTPALVETLLDAKRRADAAGHGRKHAIYAQTCAFLGISRATLARHLKSVAVAAPRKPRRDAGHTHLSLEHARVLSAAMMEGFRANDKSIHALALALARCRANWPGFAQWVDPASGEIRPLSQSACARALRGYGLHPAQLRQAAPAVRQRSLHPNDVWQIDASISTLFYVPDEGVADMAPAVFYKNKPENFERIKRQRLTRYVITDHCSGAIFVHYVAGGESVINMAESFLAAIAPRPGQHLHGVPFHLSMDPGSAGMGGAMKNLLRALQVAPVVNRAGNPRAKGQVENAHNLVETNFESGFKFAHVPGIDWINEQAARWMRYYNSVPVHSRHGKTRYAKWREISAEQLRLVDPALARQKLLHAPATPKVDAFLQVRFAGRVWNVRAVPGVMVGATLAVTHNPFNPDSAYVIAHDAQGREQVLEVPRVMTDEHGFAVGAALIGREFKGAPDTVASANQKRVERIATGAGTDAQAQAARKARALPFGGALDPYKHHDDLPLDVRHDSPKVALLPRRGTALDTGAAVRTLDAAHAQALSAEDAMFRLRAGLARNLTGDEYAFYAARFAAGVTEEQIDALVAQAVKRDARAPVTEAAPACTLAPTPVPTLRRVA